MPIDYKALDRKEKLKRTKVPPRMRSERSRWHSSSSGPHNSSQVESAGKPSVRLSVICWECCRTLARPKRSQTTEATWVTWPQLLPDSVKAWGYSKPEPPWRGA